MCAQAFGTVENMIETRMRAESIHQVQPEIFLVHNQDYSRVPTTPASPGPVEAVRLRSGWCT